MARKVGQIIARGDRRWLGTAVGPRVRPKTFQDYQGCCTDTSARSRTRPELRDTSPEDLGRSAVRTRSPCSSSYRTVIPAFVDGHRRFGGPGRDRTDDLFHAMERTR
jgi:hypothetical protein